MQVPSMQFTTSATSYDNIILLSIVFKYIILNHIPLLYYAEYYILYFITYYFYKMSTYMLGVMLNYTTLHHMTSTLA